MAYTVTRYKTVFGDKRAVGLVISADNATQTVETGLQKIDWMSVGVVSATTMASMKIAINSNASGVQSYGVLGMSGFTNGDVIHVTVYGS